MALFNIDVGLQERQDQRVLDRTRRNRQNILAEQEAFDRSLVQQQKKSLVGRGELALNEAGVTDPGARFGAGYQIGAAQTSAELEGALAALNDITQSNTFSPSAAAATAQAQNMARAALVKAQADAEHARMTLAGQQGGMPDRMVIPVMQPGTNTVSARAVDTPSSAAYGKQLGQIQASFSGSSSLAELIDLVGQHTGTEFTGPKAKRMSALAADAVLGYAEAKGMGALQAPDLEIARKVIPDPSGWWENLQALFRTFPGGIDTMLGIAMTGGDQGFFGLGREAQLIGLQQAYQVATDDIYLNIVQTLMRNPVLLNDVADDQLARIPPDIAAPIMPYLIQDGRDPWVRQ